MALFLDKHLNYLNNKIKQKIICIPFVLTSDDDLRFEVFDLIFI